MRAGFPKAGNTPWAGFGGDCETRNDGDPIVQYDQLANRWILTQFAVANRSYMQCVAVSTHERSRPGTYNRYAFSYTDFPDYPKLTVWPDAYYITFNMFRNGRTFTGGRACAYDKAAMMAGGPATSGVLPGLERVAAAGRPRRPTPPPAGTPNYVLSRGSNALNLWQVPCRLCESWRVHVYRPDVNSGGQLLDRVQRRRVHSAEGHEQQARLAGRPAHVPARLPQFRQTTSALVVNHSVAGRQRDGHSVVRDSEPAAVRRQRLSSRARICRPTACIAGWAASRWTRPATSRWATPPRAARPIRRSSGPAGCRAIRWAP